MLAGGRWTLAAGRWAGCRAVASACGEVTMTTVVVAMVPLPVSKLTPREPRVGMTGNGRGAHGSRQRVALGATDAVARGGWLLLLALEIESRGGYDDALAARLAGYGTARAGGTGRSGTGGVASRLVGSVGAAGAGAGAEAAVGGAKRRGVGARMKGGVEKALDWEQVVIWTARRGGRGTRARPWAGRRRRLQATQITVRAGREDAGATGWRLCGSLAPCAGLGGVFGARCRWLACSRARLRERRFGWVAVKSGELR